jgi:signal transduction histidine kinase
MAAQRRHTILVVDDEADVVASVKDLLRLDYKVLGATRAAEGLALLENNEVHVVMTDQRMPEISGVELLAQVRRRWPDAIRLLFTGYADIRAVIDAINQGNVYRYITKPWDPDELLTLIRDACAQHDLLAERKRLIAELQSKNQELQKANADLRRADELKNAFVQVASHELRTPLTILVGVADLAKRQPGVEEPMAGLLRRIQQAGQRLQHLINQILTMLAAQQFERRPNLASEDLAVVIGRAVDDVRPFVELRHQRLVLEVPPELGRMDLDEQKIRDALNHLLLNAVKFTPDGGALTVSASRDREGGAVIKVADTGVGIASADLGNVFDRFFTTGEVSHHSSGHYEYGKKGLGLGLSVVKAFVQMHGGTVSVESAEGKGTTFTIRLPGAMKKGEDGG